MVSAGAFNGNGWKDQPRDPNTGRFLRRKKDEPRSEMLKIRLTPSEMRQIRNEAEAMGMTITAWLVYKATT